MQQQQSTGTICAFSKPTFLKPAYSMPAFSITCLFKACLFEVATCSLEAGYRPMQQEQPTGTREPRLASLKEDNPNQVEFLRGKTG